MADIYTYPYTADSVVNTNLLLDICDRHFDKDFKMWQVNDYTTALKMILEKLDEYKKQIEEKDKIIARLLGEDK